MPQPKKIIGNICSEVQTLCCSAGPNKTQHSPLATYLKEHSCFTLDAPIHHDVLLRGPSHLEYTTYFKGCYCAENVCDLWLSFVTQLLWAGSSGTSRKTATAQVSSKSSGPRDEVHKHCIDLWRVILAAR
eukprot:4021010-Amphidinium_carterae.1